MSFWDTLKKIGTAATNFIPVVGPMVSQGLGALLPGGGSEGAKDMTPEQIAAIVQASKDSARARELTESAVGRSREGLDFAKEEWGKGESQREGYRTGAMDFSSAQNPFARNPATGMPSGGGAAPYRPMEGGGGFDPNAKFMASIGMMPGPSPGFAPSTGYGGTGGYTPPNPTNMVPGGIFGGLFDQFGGVSEGGPMSQVMGEAAGGMGGSVGSLANRVMQRFGGQERGSMTDFITPSRRGSSIKRAV